jgi:hypothetical protein
MTEQQRRLTRSRHVDVQALAPLVMIAALVLFVAIFTKWGIAAAIVFWSLLMIGLVVWSVGQLRRARREIRGEIEQSGCKVTKMNYRHLRLGPFSLLDSSRSQLVYRVVVQEATGRERIVWARWGRRWFWNPDALELKWEDETS